MNQNPARGGGNVENFKKNNVQALSCCNVPRARQTESNSVTIRLAGEPAYTYWHDDESLELS